MSAYGELAARTTDGDAAAIFAGSALIGSLVLWRLRPHGEASGPAIAGAGVCTLAVVGAVAYTADRAMTERTLATFAASTPDWLDERGPGEERLSRAAGAQAHAGWNLETWNRDFGMPIRFGPTDSDGYRLPERAATADGRLRSTAASSRPARWS